MVRLAHSNGLQTAVILVITAASANIDTVICSSAAAIISFKKFYLLTLMSENHVVNVAAA